jgi:hypothetical protein
MNQLDKIKSITGTTENSCSCNTCKNMCKKTPCIGTPEDIARIIANGQVSQLSLTLWGAGIPFGISPVEMVQPKFDYGKRQCSFLTEDELCQLHNIGLKPTEGKLADHTPLQRSTFKESTTYQVASTWLGPGNTTATMVLKYMVQWLLKQDQDDRVRVFTLPEKLTANGTN